MLFERTLLLNDSNFNDLLVVSACIRTILIRQSPAPQCAAECAAESLRAMII